MTVSYALPRVGPWRTATTVHLVQRNDIWKVAWTPATINPALGGADRLATVRDWPLRAQITGAGGAPLIAAQHLVDVGLVGSRIKSAKEVGADLIAAGATAAEVKAALAQAKAHPTFFEPVFQISQTRFIELKAQPGPRNVYAVPGTQFQQATARSAITAQLAAHLVGTVGPITADQLKALGSPYDASSQVGQTGLEYAAERQLAGTPTTKVIVETTGGSLVKTLASFPAAVGVRSAPASIPACSAPPRARWPASTRTSRWWRSAPPPARCWPWSQTRSRWPTTPRSRAPTRPAPPSRCSPRPR